MLCGLAVMLLLDKLSSLPFGSGPPGRLLGVLKGPELTTKVCFGIHDSFLWFL